MKIKEYYRTGFRRDLIGFMPDAQVQYFGHSWHVDCRGLENVPKTNRAAFLICLYVTVLVDQAMHAHFRSHYPQFAALTRYPKFCHGLGQFQKNPRAILLEPIKLGFIEKSEIDRLLEDGMILFVEEVVDFFSHNMPAISPDDFFDKLLYDPDVQIPEIIVLIDPSTKDDIGVRAYAAIKSAVDKELKEKKTK